MGNIRRLERKLKAWPEKSHRLNRWPYITRKPSRSWRWRSLPWPPLAALIAVAAGLYVAAEEYPDMIPGSADFHICVRGSQQNCVIDGDTLRYDGMTIRLADIDTPEIRDYKCAAELALGQKAKYRLLEWMNAGPFDVVSVRGKDIDIYGRKLRIIERDGRSVGVDLVAEGLARRNEGRRRSWCV